METATESIVLKKRIAREVWDWWRVWRDVYRVEDAALTSAIRRSREALLTELVRYSHKLALCYLDGIEYVINPHKDAALIEEMSDHLEPMPEAWYTEELWATPFEAKKARAFLAAKSHRQRVKLIISSPTCFRYALYKKLAFSE